MKRTLQWHPAFQAAMQIELAQEADKLQFLKEFNLTNGPLRVDTLVIKADRGVRIQKRIGRIFRQYNILEYKSPSKSHTVNGFFKVMSYAGLLQSGTEREREIPPEEITITLVGDRYPRRLLAFLKKRYQARVTKAYPGIYYVEGLLFSLQGGECLAEPSAGELKDAGGCGGTGACIPGERPGSAVQRGDGSDYPCKLEAV